MAKKKQEQIYQQQRPEKKSPKIWIWFLILLLTGAVAGGAIYAPTIINQNKIARSQVATYSVENYVGWALAYAAIDRANNTLYSGAPTDTESPEYAKYKNLNYPKKFFPDLVEEFGIVVQKDYSSNYIFRARRQNLIKFTSNLSSQLTEAESLYRDSSDPQNANDANVREALSKYKLMVDGLNTSLNTLTLEQAQSGALGQYFTDQVGTKTMSDPIAYGEVAESYLKRNLDIYRETFRTRQTSGEFDHALLQRVEKIVGLK